MESDYCNPTGPGWHEGPKWTIKLTRVINQQMLYLTIARVSPTFVVFWCLWLLLVIATIWLQNILIILVVGYIMLHQSLGYHPLCLCLSWFPVGNYPVVMLAPPKATCRGSSAQLHCLATQPQVHQAGWCQPAPKAWSSCGWSHPSNKKRWPNSQLVGACTSEKIWSAFQKFEKNQYV